MSEKTDFIRDKMRLCGDPVREEKDRIRKELFRIRRAHLNERRLTEPRVTAEQILCEVMEAVYEEDLKSVLKRVPNGEIRLERLDWVEE